ncbi:class I SAM-dependent methyltransferase [Candidatus Gracilibacteria bacterium]|nr:class I SAM-dependent methyltransferase [Candidatus Gracilibacteria bacterium]
MLTEIIQSGYTSSNLLKHINRSRLQQMLLRRFHRTAAEFFAQTGARSVLDAGCGEGFAIRELLSHHAATVVGLDGSVGALRVATMLNPQRSFAAGDLLELPFPNNSFDLVVCMEVLEHLDNPREGLDELCRVSREWLLLTVPNEPFFRGANFMRGKNMHAFGNDPGHVNHWSARAFLRFVTPAAQVVTWRTSFPWTLVLCRIA